MVSKKPVKPKPIIPSIKEEIKKEEKYESVFPKIVISKHKSTDLNYYGIKQILRKYGLDLFKKLKKEKIIEKGLMEDKKPNSHRFMAHDFSKYYDEMNQLILSWWKKYCDLWEVKINGK